jgi:hypothetical protein
MTAALVHSIEAYAAEINKVHTPKATQTGRETKSWSRPPPGVLKLNCDAAFSEDSKSGGWGVRDVIPTPDLRIGTGSARSETRPDRGRLPLMAVGPLSCSAI